MNHCKPINIIALVMKKGFSLGVALNLMVLALPSYATEVGESVDFSSSRKDFHGYSVYNTEIQAKEIQILSPGSSKLAKDG